MFFFLILVKESSDNAVELKQFFDANYSQIYFIFYESFINFETNLKQKSNKINKEELEAVLYVFQVTKKAETILCIYIHLKYSYFLLLLIYVLFFKENTSPSTGKNSSTMASEKHRTKSAKAAPHRQC